MNVFCYSVAVFRGHINSTFYVKAVLSPDDKYLLGGSSDGNAYIWQVSRPRLAARVLQGHRNEVTGVDWCRTDVGRLVTLSDDNAVWVWRIDHSHCDSAEDGRGVIGRTSRTACRVGQLLLNKSHIISTAIIRVNLLIMSSPPDNVGKGIMFWGCPSTRLFIRSERYCYLDVLLTARAVSVKLTGINH